MPFLLLFFCLQLEKKHIKFSSASKLEITSGKVKTGITCEVSHYYLELRAKQCFLFVELVRADLGQSLSLSRSPKGLGMIRVSWLHIGSIQISRAHAPFMQRSFAST